MSERFLPKEVEAVSSREKNARQECLNVIELVGKERLFKSPAPDDDYSRVYDNKYSQYTEGLQPGEEMMDTNNLWQLFRLQRQEDLDHLLSRVESEDDGSSYEDDHGKSFDEDVRLSLWTPEYYYLKKSGSLKRLFETLGLDASEDFLKAQRLVEAGTREPAVRMKHEFYLKKIFVLLKDMGFNMETLDG
jgi:hypothetical protein